MHIAVNASIFDHRHQGWGLLNPLAEVPTQGGCDIYTE